MIVELALLQQLMWAVNTAAGVFVLLLLYARKNYRAYPAFTIYIVANLAQAILLYLGYRRWGYRSTTSWWFAWGSVAVVIAARASAVVEVCRHLLARYLGVWGLAKRILVICAGLVLLYSGLSARHELSLALPSAARGLELSIATVIVVLFLFVRYYDVPTEHVDRWMATGFCIYSCFRALNDSIVNRYLYEYAELWSLLGMLAFFVSLLFWSWALREPRTETAKREDLLPQGVYQSFAPQINMRLRLLNDQLYNIWKSEVPRH